MRDEVLRRKLTVLRQFIEDLETYGRLDNQGRRREHYAIERLLQLLCEAAADIGLQLLKMGGHGLASSYREVFRMLMLKDDLPEPLADRLMDACAMRNLLTHLYDTVDLERVIAAVDPAGEVYSRYAEWVERHL